MYPPLSKKGGMSPDPPRIYVLVPKQHETIINSCCSQLLADPDYFPEHWSTAFPIRSEKFENNCRKSEKTDIQPSNAVMSFIPEVQLCMSSLPGYEFGVCSRKLIPKDTVIGPYNGKRVRPEELRMGNGANMSFLWEVWATFLHL